MLSNLEKRAKSLGRSFRVERVIDQLEGRDPDYERRSTVLEEEIQYFEFAKYGLLDIKAGICWGNWLENLYAFNHLLKVDPKLQELETVEALVVRLDEYTRCLKTLKDGEGQISEEVKQQLLGFYKKLEQYESKRRHVLVHFH